ncbi:hypothetical protein HYC85_028448 [Camellia sinensis]|uniref:non-specific serine/threonine protein kinase n=1 Tax=Camellia sinensis TaxID=4442 RepID=A0A7J7FVZ4_CAMSI|nr:hypothetical protein HYC85_028448 [Camellia sinensis]
MASIVVVVLLIFFILFAAIEAQKKTSNLISLGSFLSPISKPNSWLSPSGLFAFGFYPERNGFAAGIWIIGNPNNTVVWTANRDYPPVSSNSTIEFTRDGRLILKHTQQGTELAIADFTTPSRVFSASMLDSGNFVIYNNDSSIIWQSSDFPTDTILGNQTLVRGRRLVSSASSSFDHSSGRYRLQMQFDGNLVAFPINCSDPDFAYASASASSLPGANGYYNLTITISGLRLLTLANASASGASPLVIIYRATLDDDGIFRHRVHKYKKLSDNAKLGLSIDDFSLRSFSYNELEEATQGFREEMGKGSFGTVYKGTLLSGGNKNIVAVKRLENIVEDEGDREFQFQTEVTAIGRTHHRNLVRLLGFCVEGRRKLLVYEYMNNGSLADVLFKEDTSRHLGWKERVKIALDIARGILYLHEECEACIVHCGRSRGGLMVTVGTESSYMAPEWRQRQQQQQRRKEDLISVKVDIYSFGVVLLEIICSRRNIEVNVSNEDEMILSTWVYKCFVGGELHKLLVGDEEMRVDSKTLERMVKVGLLCVQDDPGMRPSIKDVILMLEGTMNIPVPPPPYPISLQ